jgi:hypothetical protein
MTSPVADASTGAAGSGSSPSADVETGRRSRSRRLADLIGVAIVVIVVIVGYFEVPFAGKTVSTSAQAPGFDVCGTTTGACARRSINDPRFDPKAASSALEPWNFATHRALEQHQVPLWNTYQGIGMPLAANMQSGVFDPMMLPMHVHPTPLVLDMTALFGLIFVGIAAYVAARAFGLSPTAATVSGSIYGLSGWFFVYVNNQWFRVYIFFPLILACVEWSLRSTRRLPVVLLGVSIAGLILVGMPEPTFITLMATGVFSAVRLFVGPQSLSRTRNALRLIVGAALGVAIAGPQLMIFREYLPLSYNRHSNLSNSPPETDPIQVFLNWMMPRISPSSNSNYSFSRNWVGAGAMLAAATAVLHPRLLRRYAGWPLLAAGAVVGIQIYGGRFVAWTRFLPVWSQVLWPTFATPIIALSLALLAGIGVQGLLDGEVIRWRPLLALAGLVTIVAVVVLAARGPFALNHDVLFAGGWPLAAVAAALITAAACLLSHRAAGIVVVVVIVLELVVLAPRGFYSPRQNPYPSRPWITYVSDHTAADGARVFSTNGLLYPNTAQPYGLHDPRMVDALYVDRYWRYLRTFVAREILDRWIAVGPTEGAPNVAANQMFDLLGVQYVLYRTTCNKEADPPCVSVTSPPSWAGSQYVLVTKSNGVKVYENTNAMPRAFIVHDIHRVKDETAALNYLKRGERQRFPDGAVQVRTKDVRRTAVVEGGGISSEPRACPQQANDQARLVSSSANQATVTVDAACAGLLVLSDQYYPGWSATVNGRDSTIFATDATFRGVSVPAGRSTVEFHYRPSSFRLGLVLFVLGLVAVGAIAIAGGYSSTWYQDRKRRRGAPATEIES